MNFSKMLLAGIMTLFFITSCTDDEELNNDTSSRINGYAMIETQDASTPYILNNELGEEVWFKSDQNNHIINEIDFMSPNGGATIVTLSDQGVPELINDGQHIYIIENVTNTSIDVAVISSDGSIETFRKVQVEGLLNARVRNLDTFSNILHALRNSHQVISVITGLVSCASTPVNVFAVAACAGALYDYTSAVYNFLNENDQLADNEFVQFFEQLRASADDFFDTYGISTELADCINPLAHSNRVTACVGTLLTLGTEVVDLVKIYVDQNKELIDLAIGSLNSGDGEVKVTLTWDNSTDLDLHIFDPNGEEIYYGNNSVTSGGYLDVDDVDGFGPENIYWDQAISGQYSVYVNYYSGRGVSNYHVRVQSDGYTKVYSGSLVAEDSYDQVVSFTFGDPLGQDSPVDTKLSYKAKH